MASEMSPKTQVSSRGTRSSGPVLDPNLVFPECKRPTTQLPDIKMVIGMIKFWLREGTGVVSEGAVLREVSKLVYTKWWHDTVYCIHLDTVVYRVKNLWKDFKEGVKRMKAGRDASAAVQRYKDIVQDKDLLFDIFPKDKSRMDFCELDWGVKMSLAEKDYYEDQKQTRKQQCDRAVDPVWYTAMMRKQRLKERSISAQSDMQKLMSYKSMQEIEESLQADGDIL